MNIAFDIHGTLDVHKKMRDFLWILERFQHVTSNVRVFIISGAPKDQLLKEMYNLNLPEKVTVISVVDYLKSKGVMMWQNEVDGSWWCHNGEWWASKGDICREYDIDILIDNETKYKDNLPPSTIFLQVRK